MKILAAVLSLITLAGCAASASQDYYLASQQLAVQSAQAYQARMVALTEVAKANPQQTGAIAMAIALSEAPQHQVAYIEDPALKWASVLAGPVAAVAGVYINSQQAVDLAEINAGTQQARIQYDAQNQQAAYGALAAGGQSSAAVTAGALEFANTAISAVVDVTGMGYDAVGQSIESNASLTVRFLDSVDSTVANSYDFSTGVLSQTYDWSQFLIVEPTVIEVPTL